MTGPLEGIRVVDITTAVLGPVSTQILGDMGADVIKVETPQGDAMRDLGPARNPGMAAYFLSINQNKRSLVLDLKKRDAREALYRLIGTADVLVHNMRPGAAKRLGIDYESLAGGNPRLVYASASGFAKNTAEADRPAFDDVIQGESGLAALNATIAGEPRYIPQAVCDKLCGMALASGVGMALFRRERTGKGQEVHIPMLDTVSWFILVEHLWNGVFGEPEKGVGYPRMLSPYRRPLKTSDGHVCLLAHSDDQWSRFFGALDCPEMALDERFATMPARLHNIDALYEIVTDRMRGRSTAEWRRRLDAADVPNGGVTTLEELVTGDYLRESGFFESVDHPTEGRLTKIVTPTVFSESPTSLRVSPPHLGQHTREILSEIGYDDEEIAAIADNVALTKTNG